MAGLSKKKTAVLRLGLALAVVGSAAVGCSVIQRQEAASADRLLLEAGFQIRPADSPQRAHQLDTMPPLKMVMTTDGGRQVYSYADPYKCQCVYVGGPKEYADFRRLRTEQAVLNDDRLDAVSAAEDADMDQSLWGPWWW